MENKKVIMVGAIESPREEEKYNKWYNEVHGPMLLKFKGLLQIDRYKILTANPDQPRYFNIMTFASQQDMEAYATSPERMAALEEVKKSWPEGPAKVTFSGKYGLIKSLKK